ncbi:MAG: type II secretion system protein [Hydrogenovibrio sp.]|uniref:type II secretion system protein n=1 Tax=Hydrogenovibrio sp. TaxID=2065821 RepID=UPI0028708AD1|nr:type II secretion system protein [Hydrogenovibrio sp.]MDR9497816.1 type II secretion system protein [Hydrogenovibrio sp.]
MIKRQWKAFQAGFSLVELAVVIAILGVVALGISQFLPEVRQLFSNDTDQVRLDKAESAIKGFVLSHHRLPCPDTNDDGEENCAPTNVVGKLPYSSLGLASPVTSVSGQPIKYAIYHNSSEGLDLSEDADIYTPQYPNEFDADFSGVDYEATAPSGISNITQPTATSVANGLDFCWGLKSAATSTENANYLHLNDDGDLVHQAYVLVSPGNRNIDFQGLNSDTSANPVEFESANRNKVIAHGYDDWVRGVGFYELSSELNCPALLAEVNTATRQAQVQYETLSLAQYRYHYRVMLEQIAQSNKAQAEFSLAMAIINGVITTGQNATAIAAGAESFGVAVATLAIPAAASSALAIYAIAEAGIGLDEANAELLVAQEKLLEAEAAYVDAYDEYDASLRYAESLNLKGW